MPFDSDRQRKFLWATKPEVAKKKAEHLNMGGMPMDDRKPSKVTQKDRYGNQVTFEYAPDTKPLDPTALAKHAMDMNMEVPEISMIDMDAGHPGEPMGSDTVPAWLTPGEFVVNAEAMRIPGAKEAVEDINNQGREIQAMQGGSIPHYDQGGAVKDSWWNRRMAGIPQHRGYIDDPDDKYETVLEQDPYGGKYLNEDIPRPGHYVDQATYYTPKRREYVDEEAARVANNLALKAKADEIGFKFNQGGSVWDQLKPITGDTGTGSGWTNPNRKPVEVPNPTPHVPKDKISPIEHLNPVDILKVLSFYKAGGGPIPGYYNEGSWVTDELLDSLAFIESSNNNDAVSKAGAIGKYQWLPSSAKQAGYGVKPFDPKDEKAARAATKKYLENMQKHHGFTPEETLQAYNWGPGNVLKHKAGKRKDVPKEAAEYAGKIFKHLDAKKPPEALPTPRPEEVGVPQAIPTARPEGLGIPEVPITREAAQMPAWQSFLNEYVLGDKLKFNDGGPVYAQSGHEIVPEIKTGGHAMFGGDQNLGGGLHPLANSPEGIIANDANIGATDIPNQVEPSFWDKYVLGPKLKDEAALTEEDKGFLDNQTATNEKLASAELAEEENQIADEYNPIQDVESAIVEGSGTKDSTGEEVAVDSFGDNTFQKEVADKTKDKIFNKIDADTKNAEGPGADQKGENKSEKEVVDAAKTDPTMVNKATSFLKDTFGGLFDTKELGRMAVMYAGSRLLGYNHQGSLRFAAKNYIQRIDAKAANRDAFIKSNAKNYTAQSLQQYKESGDLSQLVPVGTPSNRTGEFKTFYGNGKAIKAEKIKVGKNTMWSTDGGKTFIDGTKFNSDPAYVKGTKENKTMVNNFISRTSDQLKSLRNQFDKYGAGDDIAYNTDINPHTSSGKIAEWAVKNGVQPDQLAGLVESAYHDAINDKRQDGSRARNLVPYLNQLIIRQKVGNPDLFVAKGFDAEDGGAKQYVNAQKLQTLNRSVAHVMQGKGMKGGTQDLANQFYNAALRDWNKLSTKEQEKYIGKALDDESGFYKFIETQALKYAQ